MGRHGVSDVHRADLWIPYVGYFLLGPALLEVRVGRRAGLIWTAVALGGIAFSTLTPAYPGSVSTRRTC